MLHGVEGGDVRAIHRTRVATRRLREVLPILQLDAAQGRKLGRRLKRITERLGTVRELDVLMLLLDELRGEGKYDPRALQRTADAVSEARAKARDRLMSRLPVNELRRLARKLEGVAGNLERADMPPRRASAWRWAVDARVAQRAGRLDRAMQAAGSMYLPERLHEVRIAVKKLRYAVELSSEIAGRAGGADARALKRGQELLGQLHDVQVLIDWVRQVQASLNPPDLAAWRDLDALVRGLENSCRRMHARYMRQRATLAAICNRLTSASRASTARRASAG